jgi:uncharacterized protein
LDSNVLTIGKLPIALDGLPAGDRPRGGLGLLLIVYLGAFVVGAVFAPPIYQFCVWMGHDAPAGGLWHYLAHSPFPRYVDRIRMLAAAVSLLWLIGYCGLWGRFGFDWGQRGLPRLGWAWLAGVVSLGLIALAQLAFGGVTMLVGAADWPAVLGLVLRATLAGLVLAWLEEALFRGMVWRMFARTLPLVWALLGSAVFFAVVHFKKVPFDAAAYTVTWYSGFEMAWRSLWSIFYTFDALRFLNLLLVGLLLNLVFLRSGSLIPCLGLHAGWVMVRGVWGGVAVAPPEAAGSWWGGLGVVDGWAAVVLLTVWIGWLVITFPSRHTHVDSHPVSTDPR